MKLETPTGLIIKEPSSKEIEETLRSLNPKDNSIAILDPEQKKGDGNFFLQTACDEPEKFMVEYRDGLESRQFQSQKYLPLETVIIIFQTYRLGDESWKNLVEWGDITEQLKGREIV